MVSVFTFLVWNNSALTPNNYKTNFFYVCFLTYKVSTDSKAFFSDFLILTKNRTCLSIFPTEMLTFEICAWNSWIIRWHNLVNTDVYCGLLDLRCHEKNGHFHQGQQPSQPAAVDVHTSSPSIHVCVRGLLSDTGRRVQQHRARMALLGRPLLLLHFTDHHRSRWLHSRRSREPELQGSVQNCDHM